MHMFLRFIVCFLLVLLATGHSALYATWYYDGIAVCDQPSEQVNPRSVPDGSGGAIIFWEDYRFTNVDIFVQRIDSNGLRLWSNDGEVVCTAANTQSYTDVVADGAGGAFITWVDQRGADYDIYAQRVDANGNYLWTVDGIAISTASYNQYSPQIIADGEGGAIITWYTSTMTSYHIYAQKVDASGGIKWTSGGVLVCGGLWDSYDPQLVSDVQGGAIITWRAYPGADADVLAQRIDDAGNIVWAGNGVTVCGFTGAQYSPLIVSDSMNGAIIAWRDNRGADSDIYAQRIDAGGIVQWTVNGVTVCTATGSQQDHQIISDGGGGAIITWEDNRGGMIADVYAQRIDASGTARWTVGGVTVCVETNNQYDPLLIEDQTGGAVIAWNDYRNLNSDIYAQKIDSLGIAQWMDGGISVCTAPGYRGSHSITSNGSNGAFISWNEIQDTKNDIYVARISEDGRYGCEPDIISVSDVPGDQGGWVKIRISASTHDGDYVDYLPVTGYNVWRKAGGSVSAVACVVESKTTIEEAIAFNLPPGDWESIGFHAATQDSIYDLLVPTHNDSTSTGTHWETYLVTAHTTIPRTYFETYSDSGYSVDNLAPGAPSGLTGEYVSAPPGITLNWEPNAESDLWYYAVYRGGTEGFVPGPGNLIGTTTDITYVDEYDIWYNSYYKVSAVDRHENESPFALLRPDDMTGEEPPEVPAVTYLSQNFPNPFNPQTTIRFGLKEPMHVTIKIFDASGSLVRVLVDGHRKIGQYAEIWDGRSGTGYIASSGIYFYRLVAGDYVQTRKMVLLR